MIKYSIECWLYNDLEDRFLLLRCPVTHRHDEYWQPVTGGRGPDEPCVEACLREVLEETGVTLSEEQLEVVIPEFSFCIPRRAHRAAQTHLSGPRQDRAGGPLRGTYRLLLV